MHPAIKNTLLFMAIAATGLLSLRGATAFYKQYTALPEPVESLQVAQNTLGKGMPSKAERLNRANVLVAGMGKQGRVTDVFSAPDGTTGVVIKAGDGYFVGWMVDGIEALWVGAKFEPKGRNMTQEEMLSRGYAQPMDTQTTPANANPSAPTGAPALGRTGANPAEMPGLLKAVSQSAGVIEGSAGPIWTVYYDGNCDFCNQLWRNLRAPLAAGQIRVRWAPVAVIGPSSAGKAATLLQSDQPLTVLAHHGLNGERIAESAVTTTSRALIDGNNAMLRALNGGKAPATPTLVIPTNALPMVITGIPPDLDALIRAGKS